MPFYENPELALNVLKVFGLGAFAFIVAFFLTPILTHFLYKYKLWRKEARTKALDGWETPIFHQLHKERETTVPRFGGILIWITTLILSFLFYFLSNFTDIGLFNKLNFLSRSQTWLPLFTLVVASVVGFFDDFLQVFGRGKYIAGGMILSRRILIVFLIGLIGALWFYSKLEWRTIHIPLIGDFRIGILYVPFFVITMLATYSGGVIDGLDGLAGGAFASIFAAYGGIALFRGQIDLATFCFVIVGAISAFLWFNIPPARFYMSETGILGLTTTLTVVAFLTDSVIVLPIIGFLLVMESGSVILQLLSKKIRHKKIWLSTPIHHHFEALGWPPYKVTMRFWVIGIVLAIIGVAIRLLG